MHLACTQCHLTPAEALSAVTVNAAHVLGIGERTGRLRVGQRADIALLDVPDWRYLAYRLGSEGRQACDRRGRVGPGGLSSAEPRSSEKRRRKLRVHGPSTDAVGAPPDGPQASRARTHRQRGRRARAVASRRSRRSSAPPARERSWASFLVVVVLVTSRGHHAPSPLVTLLELAPFIPLFVLFDLWMARKVYKRVTGREAPR